MSDHPCAEVAAAVEAFPVSAGVVILLAVAAAAAAAEKTVWLVLAAGTDCLATKPFLHAVV
jgi:hypothetical protein